jgi:dolichol-phosphate mannosyltransferase
MHTIDISVVVPAYNEEENIFALYERLNSALERVSPNHEIVFVDDGSKDLTVEKIMKLRKADERVKLVSFARNFGHEMANTAGFRYAKGEAVVIIDADLQDPPELIVDMYAKFKEGFDVVYAKRISRKKESFVKKVTSKGFYRVMNSLSDVEVPLDTGDFRLLSRRVVDEINALEEHNRYFRGLTHWVGFNVGYVEFHRDERFAGETKYNYIKLFKLAFDAILSFSYKPLKIFSLIGLWISGLSFLTLLYLIVGKVLGRSAVAGWTSMMAIMLFCFGILMVQVSIIGEYVGRIYEEVKNRPLFIIGRKEGIDD